LLTFIPKNKELSNKYNITFIPHKTIV